MIRPLMTLAGAASLALCATVSASALTANAEQRSNVFHFQTEKLLTEQGVSELRRALRSEARNVCQTTYPRTLHERRQVTICADAAYAGALEQLEIKVAQARSFQRNYAANTTGNNQGADS